ncbi:unnamed protein product [Caenorhabditis sp. 36 PRJEB53466]|nr:unnamed protein product [Caenorhabditis sp. 36 PRJEB53466]
MISDKYLNFRRIHLPKYTRFVYSIWLNVAQLKSIRSSYVNFKGLALKEEHINKFFEEINQKKMLKDLHMNSFHPPRIERFPGQHLKCPMAEIEEYLALLDQQLMDYFEDVAIEQPAEVRRVEGHFQCVCH